MEKGILLQKQFKHIDLNLIRPPFDSEATNLIIQLDYLRRRTLTGTTPPHIFFQIKHIFHILESIGSARIEGNRTTILEYIETKIDPSQRRSETIAEIMNMESALEFLDENIADEPITRSIVSRIHEIIVNDLSLTQEGSKTPGVYRNSPIGIAGAKFTPPDGIQVQSYMDELIDFINREDKPQYDLLKIAIAHHRFVWIHPFDNGNGRTVRMLTYAMLVRSGFRVDKCRIINPTAVFCYDRDEYYSHLAFADSGTDKDMLNWCTYMLAGLKREIEKIDNLLDYSYLKKCIVLPAINISHERKQITDSEYRILKLVTEKKQIKNSDVQQILPRKNPTDISRILRNLRRKKMLLQNHEKGRKYILNFRNNYLLRGIMSALASEGFIPKSEMNE